MIKLGRLRFGTLLVLAQMLCGYACAEKRELESHEVLFERLSQSANWHTDAEVEADQAMQLIDRDAPDLALSRLATVKDPLVEEEAIALVLRDLAALRANPARATFADAIAERGSIVWRRHEETRADWFVPLFELRAQAKALPALWRANQWRDEWNQQFEASSSAAVKRLIKLNAQSDPSAEHEAGVAAQCIAAMSEPAVERLSSEVAAGQSKLASLPVSTLLALAERRPNPSLLEYVAQQGKPEQVLRVIAVLKHWQDPAAERLLLDLERRPEWSSAATLAVVPKLAGSEEGIDALRLRLSDPAHRASTASALARLPEQDALNLLNRIAEQAKRGAESYAGIVLTLELLDSPRARARAAEFRNAASAQEDQQ